MANMPTASALITKPQPLMPRDALFLAMTGPRTPQAPAWIALVTPKAATITHSQVGELNSPQPSRKS